MIDLDKQEFWLPEQASDGGSDTEEDEPPAEELPANTNPRALANQNLGNHNLLPDDELFPWHTVTKEDAQRSDNEAEIIELESYLEDWLAELKFTTLEEKPSPGNIVDSETGSTEPQEKTLCPHCEKLRQELSNLLTPPVIANSTEHYSFRHTSDYQNFQKTARSCSFCWLMHKSLIRNINFKLFKPMLDNYGDAKSFNQGQLYNEDGVSDHSGSTKGRAGFTIHIIPVRGVQSGYAHIGLRLKFTAGFRTPKGRGTVDIHELLLVSTFSAQTLKFSHIPLYIPPEGDEKFLLMKSWLWGDQLSESQATSSIFTDPGVSRKFTSLSRPIDNQQKQSTTSIDGPGRLLWLSETHVRLDDLDKVMRESHAESVSELRYAALSHRWGILQHCTATKKRLTTLHVGVLISELPRTFQDAIIVARRLQINYLWIDALCIVQDSEEDWVIESAKMGDIYHHAQVVLAAHCAGDDSEGFLKQALVRRKDVQMTNDKSVKVRLRANFEADVEQSPLSTRGWVIQERFLASRTLHFTHGMVYFETQATILSEFGFLWAEFDPPINKIILSQPLKTNCLPRLATPPEMIWDAFQWLALVEMYCKCDLTQEKDKLIAVSGIARVLQRGMRFSYCAGLWADSLCHGLLWMPTTEPLTRGDTSRAPSWSWASVDGPVHYPRDIQIDGFKAEATLIALNHEPVNDKESPLRWLNSAGSLTLELDLVPLLDLKLQISDDPFTIGPGPTRSRDPFRAWLGSDYTYDDKISIRMASFYGYLPVHLIRLYNNYTIAGTVGWIAWDTNSGILEMDQLFCAKIAIRENIVFVIFLNRVEGMDNTFQRVGVGQLDIARLESLGKCKAERKTVHLV